MVASSLYVVDFLSSVSFPLLLFLLLRSLSPRQIGYYRMVSVNLDASCTANAWRGTQVDHSAAFEYIAQYSITTTWLEYITVQHYDHTAALELGLGLRVAPQLGQNFDQRVCFK